MRQINKRTNNSTYRGLGGVLLGRYKSSGNMKVINLFMDHIYPMNDKQLTYVLLYRSFISM